MSRSGYSEECDDTLQHGRWRAQVASASRGKRGQQFFRDLIAALDAMQNKRLITDDLIQEGEVCALGALGLKRGIPLETLDPEDPETVGAKFGIASQLAAETVYMNDEAGFRETPEMRWHRMRAWAVSNLKDSPHD